MKGKLAINEVDLAAFEDATAESCDDYVVGAITVYRTGFLGAYFRVWGHGLGVLLVAPEAGWGAVAVALDRPRLVGDLPEREQRRAA
ncbi:MAG: hypothetical protein AAGC57_08695, partial [Pseudomonadota bacterium]